MAKVIKTRVVHIEGKRSLTRLEMEVGSLLTDQHWEELPSSPFEERVSILCVRYMAEHHGRRWADVMLRHLCEQGLVDLYQLPNGRSEAA